MNFISIFDFLSSLRFIVTGDHPAPVQLTGEQFTALLERLAPQQAQAVRPKNVSHLKKTAPAKFSYKSTIYIRDWLLDDVESHVKRLGIHEDDEEYSG